MLKEAFNYGLPTVLLVLFVVGVWRAAKWVAKLIEEQIVPTFVDMRDSVRKMQEDFGEFLKQDKLSQVAHQTSEIPAMRDALTVVAAQVHDIHRHVVR